MMFPCNGCKGLCGCCRYVTAGVGHAGSPAPAATAGGLAAMRCAARIPENALRVNGSQRGLPRPRQDKQTQLCFLKQHTWKHVSSSLTVCDVLSSHAGCKRAAARLKQAVKEHVRGSCSSPLSDLERPSSPAGGAGGWGPEGAAARQLPEAGSLPAGPPAEGKGRYAAAPPSPPGCRGWPPPAHPTIIIPVTTTTTPGATAPAWFLPSTQKLLLGSRYTEEGQFQLKGCTSDSLALQRDMAHALTCTAWRCLWSRWRRQRMVGALGMDGDALEAAPGGGPPPA
jgi:hypothetical protein